MLSAAGVGGGARNLSNNKNVNKRKQKQESQDFDNTDNFQELSFDLNSNLYAMKYEDENR